MSYSPTSLSLDLLRRSGYSAEPVERWIPGANIRRDLFHAIDLVAVRADETGCLGVQCTSLPNLSARVKKARQQPELRTWLAAQNRFQCWGWAKLDGHWRVKVVELRGEDMQETVLQAPKRRGRRPVQPGLFDTEGSQAAQDAT